MASGRGGKHVVFVGGGHAHLHSLSRTGELVRAGLGVTLVDASPYLRYSGMATGVISGVYGPDDNRLDIRRLVERGGGRFVEGRVRRVLAADRELVLEGGERVGYDVASFCLGSGVSADGLLGGGYDGAVVPVKPVDNVLDIRRRLETPGRPPRVLVVGGGAAGCEVAANALAAPGRIDLTIAQGGPTLLPQAPEGARRRISTVLRDRGARIVTGTRVSSLEGGVARTLPGERIPYDLAIVATGIVPPPLFRDSGLPTGDDGGLRVDPYLRSTGDGRLFGGGDCISFGDGLPKLGVFAVRQGPVLFHNVRAAAEGRPLREYRPQRHFLYVLNLGDGTGLAVYGDLSWRGRIPWGIKHAIDERFVRRMSA